MEKCPIIQHTGNRVSEVKQVNRAFSEVCDELDALQTAIDDLGGGKTFHESPDKTLGWYLFD